MDANIPRQGVNIASDFARSSFNGASVAPTTNPLGQKIEAAKGIGPVGCSFVERCAAIGMMQQRIAGLLAN